MKQVFLSLLATCLAAAAWLALQGPVDVVREPGRMELQLAADQFRLLSEADAARLRAEAERKAAAAAPAPAPAPAPAGAPAEELPLASCVDIGGFASETAARKLRARLASVGLGDRVAVRTVDKTTYLRLTAVDAAAEVLVHGIMKDFPRQEMVHCTEAPPAH